MADKLYKDLYKLEPGVYFLRISPQTNEVSLHNLERIADQLKEEHGIELIGIMADKGDVEFIPKPKEKR